MGVMAVIVGIAALIGGVGYIFHVLERKRTEAVRTAAAQMGWEFQEQPAIPAGLPALEPFTSGHGHRARNRVSRGDASAFDFSYTMGSGKNQQHHRQTVAMVPLPPGGPSFSLRPEHLVHRIAGVFGMQDIDFPEHPEFSQKYLLRGADEAGIRGLFSDGVRALLLEHPGLAAVSSGTHLFVYHTSRISPPGEIGSLLDTASELGRRLAGGAAG